MEDHGIPVAAKADTSMQTLTLIHSESFPIGGFADALRRESIVPLPLGSLDQLKPDAGSLSVVLLDPAIKNGRPPALNGNLAIVGIGLDEEPKWLAGDSIYINLPENPSQSSLMSAVKRAFQSLHQKLRAEQLEHQLSERTRELRELSEV
jgi:hypothetical protein